MDDVALLHVLQKRCGVRRALPGSRGAELALAGSCGSSPVHFLGLSALARNACKQQLAEVGGEGLVCFLLCRLSF